MEPTITFAFNHNAVADTPWPYIGTGDPNVGGYRAIATNTDLLVWTGGGILGLLNTPTVASGTRDATIRPSNDDGFVIPQLFVEQGDTMYVAAYVGAATNRYALSVRVEGTATSELYLEAWDSHTMMTTDLEILTGTTGIGGSDGNSFINAIRTTDASPPSDWDGNSANAAYLRGTEHRVGLSGLSEITDSTVYYNIYIKLRKNCSTWHVQPVLSFRYLYT